MDKELRLSIQGYEMTGDDETLIGVTIHEKRDIIGSIRLIRGENKYNIYTSCGYKAMEIKTEEAIIKLLTNFALNG